MSTEIIVALILHLCPNPDSMGYFIQDEEATCADYYTNEIVDNPNKYKELVQYVKAE